jgi:hypothetical protein
MPLIEKEDRREEEPLRVRLNPGVAEQLKAYSLFIESSDGHIVNAALQRLFAADKEFKEFCEKNPDAGKPEPVQPVAVKPTRRRKQEGEETAVSAA